MLALAGRRASKLFFVCGCLAYAHPPIEDAATRRLATQYRRSSGIVPAAIGLHVRADAQLGPGGEPNARARLGDRPETVLKTDAHLLPQSDVQSAEQVAALIA